MSPFLNVSHVTVFVRKATIELILLEPEYGETALHQAACANNEKMISQLLSLGADPNVSDALGKTPSMCAADYGHIQSLKLLAEAHADLTGN